MAIGLARHANTTAPAGPIVYPASAGSTWIIANDDAETAQASTDLLRPAATDDATFHWVKAGPGCTRVLVRARQAVAATVTTSPVVRVMGAFGDPDGDGAFADDGTVRFLRLDNADFNATGVTLTLVSSGTGLNRDTTYAYTDVSTLDGYDLKGSQYVGILVETAANVNSGTVPVEILFAN